MANWKETKNIKHYELECKCGCGLNEYDQSSIDHMQLARDIAGVPFIYDSGCRCFSHNKSEGGETNSSHKPTKNRKASAFDIQTLDSHTKFRVLVGLIHAGFTRIGIYENFIHADDDKYKDKEVVW